MVALEFGTVLLGGAVAVLNFGADPVVEPPVDNGVLLNFGTLQGGPLVLNFGEDPDPDTDTYSMDVTTSGDEIEMTLRQASTLNRALHLLWGQAERLEACYRIQWEQGQVVQLTNNLPWDPTSPVDRSMFLPWGSLDQLDVDQSLSWNPAQTTNAAPVCMPWEPLEARDTSVCAPWAPAVPLDNADVRMPWKSPPRNYTERYLPWGQANPFDVNYRLPWKAGTVTDILAFCVPWKQSCPVEWRYFPYVRPPVPNPGPEIVFADGRAHACLDFDECDQPQTPRSSGIVLNFNRTRLDDCIIGSMTVNNNFSAKTVHDGLDLPVTGINISLDINSYTWKVGFSMPTRAELDRIRPTGTGPREVEITINGYVWRFIVEETTDARAFGSWGYTASGRGFQAYLAEPYFLPSTDTNTSQILAQQIANNALGFEAFTITWDALDWLIEPNLLSYEDKDAISVISRVISAAGYVIVPHRFDKAFTVRSLYKTSPWDWAAIPTGSLAQVFDYQEILTSNVRSERRPTFNKVFVSGTTQGNLVGVTRAGTAGDHVKRMVVDPLLDTAAIATERGRIEIAQGGNREIVTISTPLYAVGDAGPHLREPTDMVEITDDTESWRGQVVGVQIRVAVGNNQAATVVQGLDVERYRVS